MTYYAALDVSLRTVNICVIDAEGEQVNTANSRPLWTTAYAGGR